MHKRRRPDDSAPEDLADGLMSKTHAKDWNGFMKALNDSFGHARVMRRARARRNDDVRWLQRLDLFQRNAVVSEHTQFIPHLTEVLDQVVGKGIVIVDDNYHD